MKHLPEKLKPSRFDTFGLNLVLPEKADSERDRVGDSWRARGGEVTRIGRFWEPPELDRRGVRIYANDTFALVLAQKLDLHLVSPADDLLVRLPLQHIGRRLQIVRVVDAQAFTFPTFVKPVVPKQFRAGIYASWAQLESECGGLSGDTLIYESEIVTFEAEVRSFLLHGEVQDAALYEGTGSVMEAKQFLSEVAQDKSLPDTCVLDVGHIRGRGWAVIEANAAWGAGLNGCDADKVLGSIAHATRSAV